MTQDTNNQEWWEKELKQCFQPEVQFGEIDRKSGFQAIHVKPISDEVLYGRIRRLIRNVAYRSRQEERMREDLGRFYKL